LPTAGFLNHRQWGLLGVLHGLFVALVRSDALRARDCTLPLINSPRFPTLGLAVHQGVNGHHIVSDGATHLNRRVLSSHDHLCSLMVRGSCGWP
jgi:hypothetical protein